MPDNKCPHCGGEIPSPWDFSRTIHVNLPSVQEMAAQLAACLRSADPEGYTKPGEAPPA